MTKGFPRDAAPDATLALLKDGYSFMSRRRERIGADAFRARLLGRSAICIGGPEATALFYDARLFERRGALPRPVRKTLTGDHSVQTLDDAAHHARKQLFMSLMDESSIARLVEWFESAWRSRIPAWRSRDDVVLFDEMAYVLCRAVCTWAGVPLPPSDVDRRARDLAAMVDAFGGAGPRHLRGRWARLRSEAWMGGVVRQVRRRVLDPPGGTALEVFAHARDVDGIPLSDRVAATELLNILRPVVAIAWYIAFLALAMHEHPAWIARIASGDAHGTSMFVQEVRRFYPLTPFLGARVRHGFTWRGQRFRRGTLVFLDVYGTHHDPRLWPDPEEFRPNRFAHHATIADDFIPQGGGDVDAGHRCAGERATVALMERAAVLLARLDYLVLAQDTAIDLRRIPTRPRSGIVLTAVERHRLTNPQAWME